MARSFREPGHLPKLRSAPADPEGLPRQRRGRSPQMHGRYPDYDVLANARHWDELTRELVLSRAHDAPPVRFFDDDEARTADAFCDMVLAQDREPRIPVLQMVDAKLFEGELDGFRYAGMPDDRETWRLVLRGLDRAAGPGGFAAASATRRTEIVERFSDGELEVEIDASRAWSVVMRAVLAAFYSHPWAWNEIGFGGPAYPRGYMRLQAGPAGREPHEAVEAFGLDPVADVPRRGLE
jgi:hypothetical protein